MQDEAFDGLPVVWIMEGSPAERAGVRSGDRVLIANGMAMSDLAAYAEARGVYRDKLELTIQRGNQILDLVLVFDRPDTTRVPQFDA